MKQSAGKRGERANAGRGSGERTDGQRGSALLVVVLLLAVSAAMSATLLAETSSMAAELRARRSVLCARYAALGGLALDAPTANPEAAAALVGEDVAFLSVTRLRLAPGWCVQRATARCASATRTLERTLADASLCAPP